MRVVEVNYRKPANLFIAALQQHCLHIMAEPQTHGIMHLQDVENEIWAKAQKEQFLNPRCKIDDLEVISNYTITFQWYNLLYKGEKSMITIFARPDAYERCFRELDSKRTSPRSDHVHL